MSDSKDVKFSLKVVVNKQRTKVLFAEIDSDFADVLLSFLTLPLGTIVRVLKKHYGDDQEARVKIGSLTSLYDGLANLSSDHFGKEDGKMMLLNPRSYFEAEYRKLKLDISDTKTTKYYTCEDWTCMYRQRSIIRSILYNNTVSCSCGKTLKEIGIEDSQTEDGVFTIDKISFLISDDLRMVPNLAVPTMQTLRNLGITDIDGAELRNVTFGFNEIMELLKGSLLSLAPLTDIILGKAQTNLAAEAKSEPGILSQEKEGKTTTSDSNKKINLRLMVQSSTNKLLFAQSEEDFIDFLFSFLTIPLARVECILDGKTCLRNIDNLYRSLENINGDKYLTTPDTKGRLMNPKLPHGYMSKNKIIPLIEKSVLYHHKDSKLQKEWLSYYKDEKYVNNVIRCREGQGDYVKGPTMYMVTDDLTVTPSCMISSLSILKEMKVSSSDVKEVEVHVGLEEALSILKASLTSTCALTDGLKIDRMLMKQPKQEH